jgi:hypothetical protein
MAERAVVGAYQINVGLDTSSSAPAGVLVPMALAGGASHADVTVAGAQLRIWSHDNYGEDLVMNVHDGGIFYWDESGGLNARAVALVQSCLVPTPRPPLPRRCSCPTATGT